MSSSPLFTVFTPTYNRAKTLHRVYDSLRQQTFRDFEWLIVDDGSTDDTSTTVKVWCQEADFTIRYVWQKNSHKKTAVNHGVRLARGELFLIADSDDTFPPNALERFRYHWFGIPENERLSFLGVCGLCQDELGRLVGDPFPGDWGMDSDSLEMRYRFAVRGEKWGFIRTDVLRAHPFPEHLPGHVPENVVWSVIARRYKTRFINEIVRTYFQDAGNQITRGRGVRYHAPGALFSKRCVLMYEIDWFFYRPVHFMLEAARWTRFYLHLDSGLWRKAEFWPTSLAGAMLIVLMSPLGLAWWLYDVWSKR